MTVVQLQDTLQRMTQGPHDTRTRVQEDTWAPRVRDQDKEVETLEAAAADTEQSSSQTNTQLHAHDWMPRVSAGRWARANTEGQCQLSWKPEERTEGRARDRTQAETRMPVLGS